MSEKKPWLSPYIYCSDNPLSRVDPDGRQDVVTTYEAYQAYAASTAAVGSKSNAGQAIVELGNWLGHAYVHAVNQVIDKAVNSYKTITGENKQSVSQTNNATEPNHTSNFKGERNRTAKPEGTDNPYKKYKPDPNNPNKVKYKDADGKEKSKPKPDGFDDYWNKKHPPKENSNKRNDERDKKKEQKR